ncbi:hypothetical protein BGX23_011781 [Mortierella sp. AD031]|nr:hypothetical protein BGX23_011781 [Mortierella sp. AD031]
MTSIYNATRQKAVLTFQDLNEITILSGVLHVDEEHAHLSKDEILQIRRDVLQIFYTNAQQEEDLKRARAARDHWVTWCELWSSIELSAKLAADQGAESTLETTPVIDSIMAAYGDCKAKNILPVLFMALHVFRKFNTWSKLRSEADCAMAMVGPILEEVLQIQHEVKFTSKDSHPDTDFWVVFWGVWGVITSLGVLMGVVLSVILGDVNLDILKLATRGTIWNHSDIGERHGQSIR